MKKLTLILLSLLLTNIIFAQSSSDKQLIILNEQLVIKSKHTYFKKSLFPLNLLHKKNKMIQISVLGQLINEYTDISNFRLFITDTLSNQKCFIHSYGNSVLGDEKKRKYMHHRSKAKFNTKTKILTIELPIRFFTKNSVSSYTGEYRLKKGRYNLQVEYNDGKSIIKSNSTDLIVK